MRTDPRLRHLPARGGTAILCAIALVLTIGCQQEAAQETVRDAAKPIVALPGRVDMGQWTILDTRTDLTDRARAKQNVEDTLIRHPDIGCLVGLWSYNGPAILSAVKDAERAGKIPIVCFDEEDDTIQGVLDGHIHATVVQQPFEFGYQSVRILAALARGDRSVVPDGGVLDVPVKVIRPDTAREFWDDLQAKLKSADAEDAPKGKDKTRVAFVTNNASDFWKIARAGIRKAEREFDVICEFHIPPDGTAADQQRIVEALMAKGISGMAISPNDPVNQTELLNRAAQRMTVICHDSDAPGSDRICYVGTNNVQAGRVAAGLIKEVLPEGGDMMVFVGRLDAQNAKERRKGIIDELSGR